MYLNLSLELEFGILTADNSFQLAMHFNATLFESQPNVFTYNPGNSSVGSIAARIGR